MFRIIILVLFYSVADPHPGNIMFCLKKAVRNEDSNGFSLSASNGSHSNARASLFATTETNSKSNGNSNGNGSSNGGKDIAWTAPEGGVGGIVPGLLDFGMTVRFSSTNMI